MQQRYRRSRSHWQQRTALAVAVAACFAGNVVLANPTGPAVAHGQATFARQGNTLTVTNTPGTVINWQGFSIAGNEIARFIQQSQSSSVLNRVVGINPSAILGTLQSNGRVFLVNPNGITIGPGANIDVAGFLASTLNLSDADFLAGRMRFTQTPGAGSVVNHGTITTTTGGMVYLVGQDVQNSGIIRSPQGEILLAAGKSVELVDAQTPEVRVQVTAPDNQAVNLGQLIAAGGRIGMYGTLVKHSGVANANTAVVGENGKIVFRAVKDVTLEAGSVVTANGPQGGSVTAQAETGTLLASGTIDARGDAGKGGTVQLLGDRVGLIGSASVDASGQTGGGMVLVGGDFQGSNPDIPNAQRTYVGPDARIAVDAIETGDGGNVIIWADDLTRFDGAILARGGANGGNGGFAEVSGKITLIYRGTADLGAPAGNFGTLLLDPRDITIQASGSDNNELTINVPSGEIAGQILFGPSTNTNFTLSAATVSATTSANLVLQAQRDIIVDAAVTMGNDVNFIAQAGRDIKINAALTTNGVTLSKGKIHLEADSPHSGTFFDGVGQAVISAPINSCGGAVGGCAGGNITLIGGGNSSPNGGFSLNSTVQAGNGGINVALSQTTAPLDFSIGAGGNTQLSSNDTGSLKTTGPLVLGQATTAGSNGLGSGALILTVNSITNATASPIRLSTESGSSFSLVAGAGGITLNKPLTTYQNTFMSTTGSLTINETLATSGNNLTTTASSVTLGSSGSINTGNGVCAGTGCPATGIFWDEGGNDLNWFNTLNWSDNALPDSNKDVTIGTATGTILISGGTAAAKSLIALQPVQLSSGSLTLSNASNFSNLLTLSSGGSLQGTGSVAISGPNGSLAWNAGTLASGGTFLLAGGRNGTLSGTTLVLNRLFQNEGLLTLSGASVSGAGSFANAGTITISGSTTNAIVPLIVNKVVAGVNTFLGTIQVNGLLTATNFLTNAGQIVVENGGTFSTGANPLTNTATSSLVIDAGNYTTAGASVTTTSGNLAVSGALSAGTITLISGGGVTLNAASTVTATGSADDAIVISGASLTNNAGSGVLVLNPVVANPNARWLVYLPDPAGNIFGGVTSGNTAIWGRSYPTAVPETGNRYVFANAGGVTVTTTDASKTYGDIPIDLSANFALSGKPVGAATYGNVYVNSTVSDIFSAGLDIASTGNTATAIVGGGGGAGGAYFITGTGTANTGYSLTFANSGLLTINRADYTAISGSKTYDGAASFTSGQVTLSGVNSETFTVASATADSANASANSGATKFVSAGAVTGGGNYNALTVTNLTGLNNVATINRADYTAINDMAKFIVITDPITNETVVMVGSIELSVTGGGDGGDGGGGGGDRRIQKPGVCR